MSHEISACRGATLHVRIVPFHARAWWVQHRAALDAAVIAAAVFLPFLGTVGLWDPWETNYAEAAREMLERGDLIHPHWEAAWFPNPCSRCG